MINLSYRHIARMLELVDEEIEDINQRISDLSSSSWDKRVIPSSVNKDILSSGTEPAESFERKRYEKDLVTLDEIKKGLSGELEKINFTFGASSGVPAPAAPVVVK